MKALRQLAARAGLLPRWRDAFGHMHVVPVETLRALLKALDLPCESAAQIADSNRELARPRVPVLHVVDAGAEIELPRSLRATRLRWLGGEDSCIDAVARTKGGRRSVRAPEAPGDHVLEAGSQRMCVAVAPPRCWMPEDAAGKNARLWGLAAQVYGLRKGALGSYRDAGRLAAAAAALGADALALSPTHAMFSAHPGRYSPYSPSSRLFLAGWYAAPQRWSSAERRLQASELIDWPTATAARLASLRRECTRHAGDPAFAAFRKSGGVALHRHACFEVLSARHGPDWRGWPAELRDCGSAAVEQAIGAQYSDLRFHEFLQWRAASHLAAAQADAKAAGMRIGLIADLAVGSDPGGSEAWANPEQVLGGVSVGAPPDYISPLGQGWGLAALSPRGLERNGFAHFRACLGSALAHSGGVRIDHVMGLSRLWLIPDGATPREGAYLQYPLEQLLRLSALESWRRRAIVIGEDLGTVPDGFRETLRARGVLGMRVLWFEKHANGEFRVPERWDHEAVALTSTHDLPTAAGWRAARDLRWRSQLGLFASPRARAAEQAQRRREGIALQKALSKHGAARGDFAMRAAAWVGRSACALALLPLEDALGAKEQPNLPGTVDGHPNWRRRYPLSVETRLAQAATYRRLDAFRRMRRP